MKMVSSQAVRNRELTAPSPHGNRGPAIRIRLVAAIQFYFFTTKVNRSKDHQIRKDAKKL
jgi:hypothetical protein